jgi:sugar phosphate isomerase/epimerase
MRFGFYTSVLGDRDIAEVATFARQEGCDAIEIDVRSHGEPPDPAGKLARARAAGVDVYALTVTGPVLDADSDREREQRRLVEETIDVAIAEGVPVVAGFAGRDETVDSDHNYGRLAEYLAPLAARAGQVRFVIENWPGSNVNWCATEPEGWRRLFAGVPAPNLGLNLDPSHLIWQGIDHRAALDEFADRVFLTHAKDTEIFEERRTRGEEGWWTYRLPGHGVIDWPAWLRQLADRGFAGLVSIEHEDRDWGFTPDGSVERREQGVREALRVLRESISAPAGVG